MNYPPYMSGIADRRAEQEKRRWAMEQLRRQIPVLVRSPAQAKRILQDLAEATRSSDKAFAEALDAFVVDQFFVEEEEPIIPQPIELDAFYRNQGA